MDNYMLTYRSLTYAQKASRIIERAGISVAIVRTPQEVSNEGCGYALKVREKDIKRIIWILNKESTLPRKVYKVFPDGYLEEVSV